MTQQIQIGDTVRNMTADEIANYETVITESETLIEQQTVKALAKQAVLDKLGLTADEVTALLG